MILTPGSRNTEPVHDSLVVQLGSATAGLLTRSRDGRITFSYDEDYRNRPDATPLSVSMPTQVRSHPDGVVTPWLWNLLPGQVDQVTWLSDDDVAERLRELRADSTAWLGRSFTGQFSLAGAQAKTALLHQDGRWGVPHGATATTHAVVVERYDRRASGDRVQRIHQEDLCQALGIPPARELEIDPDLALSRVRELAALAPSAFAAAAAAPGIAELGRELPGRLAELIADRAGRCARLLVSGPGHG